MDSQRVEMPSCVACATDHLVSQMRPLQETFTPVHRFDARVSRSSGDRQHRQFQPRQLDLSAISVHVLVGGGSVCMWSSGKQSDSKHSQYPQSQRTRRMKRVSMRALASSSRRKHSCERLGREAAIEHCAADNTPGRSANCYASSSTSAVFTMGCSLQDRGFGCFLHFFFFCCCCWVRSSSFDSLSSRRCALCSRSNRALVRFMVVLVAGAPNLTAMEDLIIVCCGPGEQCRILEQVVVVHLSRVL